MARGMTGGVELAPLPSYLNPNVASWTNASNSIVNQNPDYANLQGQYKNIYDTAIGARGNSNVNIPQVQAQQRTYQAIPEYSRTAAFDRVMNQLQGFADSGGYSDADINAFRSRGLSPIRSIYASALNNLHRQKAIQGGYSPNYGAMQAKLAREQSGIIGQHTMDLNANIAERVQEGKKFGLTNLSPLASQEQAARDAITSANVSGINQTNNLNINDANRVAELNAQLGLDAEKTNRSIDDNLIQQALAATSGAASLYNANPTTTNNFTSQVAQTPINRGPIRLRNPFTGY